MTKFYTLIEDWKKRRKFPFYFDDEDVNSTFVNIACSYIMGGSPKFYFKGSVPEKWKADVGLNFTSICWIYKEEMVKNVF